MSDEALISAPGTITLGGKTYLVAKPSERDVFAIFHQARKEAKKAYNPFREVNEALDGLEVPIESRTALLLQAHRVKISGEVPGDAATEWLTSPPGAAFYAWVLLRKQHPEVSLEAVRQTITDENCLDVFMELDEASGADMIHQAMEDSDFFRQRSPTFTGSSNIAPAVSEPGSTKS